MKLLLCLSLAAIVFGVQALTDAQRAKVQVIIDSCKAQTGISDDTINKVRSGQTVDDPKLKEQIFCMSKKLGFMNEAGDIDVEVVKSKVKKVAANDEEVNKIIEKCAVKKDTAENTALHLFKCLKEERPTLSPVD